MAEYLTRHRIRFGEIFSPFRVEFFTSCADNKTSFYFLHSDSRFKCKQIAKISMCKQIGRCLRDQNSGFLPQETLRESYMWTVQFGYSHLGRLKNSMKQYVLVNNSRVFQYFTKIFLENYT